MNENNNRGGPFIHEGTTSFSQEMNRVYGWLFIGLLITALTAFFIATNEAAVLFIFGNTWIFFACLIAEFILVIVLSKSVAKMSGTGAALMFLTYSFVNGLTFSLFFIVYQLGSIAQVFGITAIVFGLMSVYGLTTKKDLTNMRTLAMFGLIGIIIATIINAIFLHSSQLELIVTYIGIVVFLILTAYDTKKIKELYDTNRGIKNLAISGALILYIDFINLFIYLLRILGKRRD